MIVVGGSSYLRWSSASPGQVELRSLHGSALDTLHICYGCWLSVLEGLLTVGVGNVSDAFGCSWDPFFSCWVF